MSASSTPQTVPIRSAERTYAAAGCVRSLCQCLAALSVVGIIGGAILGLYSGEWFLPLSAMVSSAFTLVLFLALDEILTLLFALHDKVQTLSAASPARPPLPPRPRP